MKWKIQRKPDKMMCVDHYDTAEEYDARKKQNFMQYDSDSHKAYMQEYYKERIHACFNINPKWGICYGGR